MKIFAVALLAGITFLTACSSDSDNAPPTTEPPISFPDQEDKNETQSSTSTTISNEIITTTTLGLAPEIGPPTSPFEAAETLLSHRTIQSELPGTFTPELDVQYHNAAQYASIEWPVNSEQAAQRLNDLGFEWLSDRRVQNSEDHLFAIQILKFVNAEGAQKWVNEGFEFELGQNSQSQMVQHPRQPLTVKGADTARLDHTTLTLYSPSGPVSLDTYGVMAATGPYVITGYWGGRNPGDLQTEALNLVTRQIEGIV